MKTNCENKKTSLKLKKLKKLKKSFFVYIVECKDKTYYTGYARDIKKRLTAHNQGKGAKYTRGRGPVKLLWQQRCDDLSTALRLERTLKNLTRLQKELLVKAEKFDRILQK